MSSIEYQPIGFLRCRQIDPMQSPRQGSLAENHSGVIELKKEFGGHCLDDLAGFSHVWVIYDFHHNKQWKPKVTPPRGSKKRGVFASRSPYRPNSIGISVVELVEVGEKSVKIRAHDLLDGTPVLDVKPYLAYADSVGGANGGWTDETEVWKVVFEDRVLDKIEWLSKTLDLDLKHLIQRQLEVEPVNNQSKRVKPVQSGWCFSYKTWRIYFSLKNQAVRVNELGSGYGSQDLLFGSEDSWQDKNIHREFIQFFPG